VFMLMLIIGFIPMVITIYHLFYGLTWPDCSYESSDGRWRDQEIQIKGRDFEDMIYFFELYKLRCDASTAKLVRTTRKYPINVFAWRNYLNDDKWKIGYGYPVSEDSANFYHVALGDSINGIHNCFNVPKTDNDYEMAREASRKFIEGLSSVKQPPLFGK
jgi:hypothetical protein